MRGARLFVDTAEWGSVASLKQITRTLALGQSLMIAASHVHLLLNGLFPFLVFDIFSFPYLNIDFSVIIST